MSTRADLIEIILQEAGRPLTYQQLCDEVNLREQNDLYLQLVRATVNQDNGDRKKKGLLPRFVTYRAPNDHLTVTLYSRRVHVMHEDSPDQYVDRLPQLIEAANLHTKQLLRAAISQLTWQEFESTFLAQTLSCMGFTEIEITQPSRDGGKDAYCKYRRGILENRAIVSAKHWRTQKVAADEVQRLRGIRGDEDTAIIFTSASFSDGAKEEARPSQNHRTIVLIDGDLIVKTCLENKIGVKQFELPDLLTYTSLAEFC